MPRELKISVGQYSDKGRKETNQDFHGVLIPDEPLLSLKGIAIVLADGISSSNVSRVAAESAVKGFLTDYYCTSESWSVNTSAQRVLAATNSWLHSQTRRSQYAYDKDSGYVCTLSAMVSSRPPRISFMSAIPASIACRGNSLEQLTNDHRVVISSRAELSRPRARRQSADRDRLPDAAARAGRRLRAGDRRRLRASSSAALHRQGDQRTAARSRRRRAGDRRPRPSSRQRGQSHGPDRPRRRGARRRRQRSVRRSRANCRCRRCWKRGWCSTATGSCANCTARSRSHIYLAVDIETDALVTIKIPSIDLRDDPRLPEALHDGGVGGAAHQQPACAEALPARSASATSSMS